MVNGNGYDLVMMTESEFKDSVCEQCIFEGCCCSWFIKIALMLFTIVLLRFFIVLNSMAMSSVVLFSASGFLSAGAILGLYCKSHTLWIH